MLVVAPFIRLCLAVSSIPSPKQPGTLFIHARQRRGAIKRRKNKHQTSHVKSHWSKILLNSPSNQPGSLTHINLTWRRHVGERVRSSSRMKASEVYHRERASPSTRPAPPPLFTYWPTSAQLHRCSARCWIFVVFVTELAAAFPAVYLFYFYSNFSPRFLISLLKILMN